MPKDLGDPVGPGHHNERFEAGASLTAGDVVAIDQSDGKVYQADTDNADRDQFAGVAEDDASSGDDVTIAVAAPTGIVANADTDGTLNGGDRVGAADSNLANEETGEFVTEDGGPGLLLTDEGGSYKGASLASGEAVVSF